ncbi:MAG TPA: hypothetical protein VFV01_47715 [Spirillospora sp.]|nr:hypothetical protein [Spirillospora sp.]
MSLYAPGLDVMGDALVAVATKVKLHTADPVDGTSNNTTAAAQTATWTSVNGQLNLSAAENFTGGAASGPVTWVSLWNTALSVCYGAFPITTGDLAFNAAGAYTLNDISITGS